MDEYKTILYYVKYEIEYYKLYYYEYTSFSKFIEIAIVFITVLSFVLVYNWDCFKTITTIFFAIAQALSLVKDYLPYSSRALELSRLLLRYENLFIEMETELSKISEKKYNIQKKIKKYKEERIKIQYEYMPNDYLKPNGKFEKIAEQSAKKYCDNWVK